MKTKLTLFMLFISVITIAQNGINYKAIIKDNNGNVVSNQSVTIQFSILQGIAETNVYQETHNVTTNNNGLIIVTIGNGTTSDVFTDIDWDSDEHFLNVQINTGSGLVNLGTTQFMAVPYALSASNISGLEAIDEGNGLGWRLIGRNPNHYGNIGLDAVDLSFSAVTSITRGATGNYSTAMGHNTIASGVYAMALGTTTTASGFNTIAMGNRTTATGISSSAFGHLTDATGDYSTAIGSQTIASGNYSTAMGSQTSASGIYSTAMGRSTIASAYSTAMGHDTEATGSYSTAIGRQSIASGINSIAMGRETIASNANSTAIGLETEASGSVSTAIGGSTIASGQFSTAMGNGTEASAYNTTAMGLETLASGFSSTAMGIRTTAPSHAETVIGAYNTNYTPNESHTWDANDRLFVVGNGQSGSRSNAITVLKNGNTGIGTDTPQELLHISGGRLRIGSETIEDAGSNALRFNASLLPDVNNIMSLGNSNLRWTTVFATNGTINTSDRREKKNIKKLNYGLAEVLQLKPVSFNWKAKNNPDLKLGLIAQDVQALIPEVVKTHIWEINESSGKLTKKELDRLGVYYSDLVPVLIKAIQEQEEVINSLNKTISKQQAKLTNQDIINTTQAKVLESLLSRVNTLEQLNY